MLSTPSCRALRGLLRVAVLCLPLVVQGQIVLPTAEPPVPMGSLRGKPVPEPPNLSDFIADRQSAIVLGKALFWDMQLGSDGFQACATCHFHAGADNRSKNTISPSVRSVDTAWNPAPRTTFSTGAPNYQLSASDFPFHKLTDPDNILSAVVGDSNNITGSQGIAKSVFTQLMPGLPFDRFTVAADSVFNIGGTNVRQVTGRTAPSVINAAFNFRNFWDGRATNDFNGVNSLGARDATARVVKATGPNTLASLQISLANAALASQALAPPVDSIETSAAGRSFRDLGLKFLSESPVRPLILQHVDTTDSVLGPFSNWPLTGVSFAYADLVKRAFQPAWWNSNVQVFVDSAGTVTFATKAPKKFSGATYSLMEYNFSLFFGLAIQMYEETLISDDAPIDRYFDGQTTALTAQQQQGLAVFGSNIGRCVNCHGGPELTNASVRSVQTKRLFRRAGNLLDNGFFNIGVRPASEDVGLGGNDAFGRPLSDARLAKMGLYTDPNLSPTYQPLQEYPGVDGAFKAPSLRNVELTAPYFHNGGVLSLHDVLDFYSRGGDFQPIASRDGAIFPLRTIALSSSDKDAVVALLTAFTDDRVRYERAPFDHPEIWIPNGAVGNQSTVATDPLGRALDTVLHVPQVGVSGGVALPAFLSQ